MGGVDLWVEFFGNLTCIPVMEGKWGEMSRKIPPGHQPRKYLACVDMYLLFAYVDVHMNKHLDLVSPPSLSASAVVSVCALMCDFSANVWHMVNLQLNAESCRRTCRNSSTLGSYGAGLYPQFPFWHIGTGSLQLLNSP